MKTLIPKRGKLLFKSGDAVEHYQKTGKLTLGKPIENLDDKLKEDKSFKLQDRIYFRGLDIAVENKKGSVRKGVDDNGEEWTTKLFYPYGYIRGTMGVDGDAVDCFVGPNKESDKVFVIHQENPENGKFDEDKAMLGFDDWNHARDAYLAHYDDQNFLGDHTEMDFDTFKEKVFKTKKKPGMIKSLIFNIKNNKPLLLLKSQMNLFGGQGNPYRPQLNLFGQQHAGDTRPGKHGTLIIKKNPSGHGAHLEYLAKEEKPQENKTAEVETQYRYGSLEKDKEMLSLAKRRLAETKASLERITNPKLKADKEIEVENTNRLIDQLEISTGTKEKLNNLMSDFGKKQPPKVLPALNDISLPSDSPEKKDEYHNKQKAEDAKFEEVDKTKDTTKLSNEDLDSIKSFPFIKNFVNQFEVAQFRKDTMKGKSEIEPSKIVFSEFAGSYAYEVAERIRPSFIKHENQFGDVLVFDNFMLRLKDVKKGEARKQDIKSIESKDTDNQSNLVPKLSEAKKLISKEGGYANAKSLAATNAIDASELAQSLGLNEEYLYDKATNKGIKLREYLNELDGLTDTTERINVGRKLMDELGKNESSANDEDEEIKPGTIKEIDGVKKKLNDKYQWENVEGKKEKAKKVEEPNKIGDFGAKIGGARKDTAESGFKKKPNIKIGLVGGGEDEEEKLPSWMKGFQLGQKENGKYQPFFANERGWIGWKDRNEYDTPEEAIMAIKMVNLAQKYGERKASENNYEVYRKVTNRKFHTIKAGFKTRDEAMRYMVENVDALLNYKPAFPERPHIEDLQRTGEDYREGDISPEKFRDTFDFSGGEFGNWVPQDERQRLLNFAFDGLMDLSKIIGVDPKTLSLDGKLSIAFGARGQGLSKAAAHYERDRAVFNLTRIKGAGSVAHEWFHALDHYLGLLDKGRSLEKNEEGKISAKGREDDFLSYGASYRSQIKQEFIDAYKNVISTILKQPKIVEVSIDRFKSQTERYTTDLEKDIRNLRNYIAKERSYGLRKKPATPEQLTKFDQLIEKININDLGEDATIQTKERFFSSISTKEVYKQLNDLVTEITGRSEYKRDWGSVRSIAYTRSALTRAQNELAHYSKDNHETRTTPTKYYYDAKDIDRMRASDYWSTSHEMAARAFESYVEDKIHEKENLSQYLVHSTYNHIYKLLFNLNPYPEGEERKHINAAFDKLFDVIGAINFKNIKNDPVSKSLKTEREAEESFDTEDIDDELYYQLIPIMKEVYADIL